MKYNRSFKYNLLLTFLVFIPFTSFSSGKIVIGSKKFPESRLLAEITAQLLENKSDLKVERRLGLGGTLICFEAIKQGEIDIYPEYTGTGLTAILKVDNPPRDPITSYRMVKDEFRKRYNIRWLPSLGFENSYALAARENIKAETISDLSSLRDEIKLGFSHEFINRPDGYQGLRKWYGLEDMDVRGMEHGLAYLAIESGQIDVTDAYLTDGKLARYNLKILKDDRDFFPAYLASLIVREEMLQNNPELQDLLDQLSGRISEEEMRKLNFLVEVEMRPIEVVAGDFLLKEGLINESALIKSSFFDKALLQQTLRHIFLTLLATLLSVMAGIPLGIYIVQNRRSEWFVLGFANIVQTIPSLAILGLMIPLLGIGLKPALAALFLYGLLPIIRNTHAGIKGISDELMESGISMGLSRRQLLYMLQLPLAAPVIMAGIKTSMVINVGTATLAAFIGAGGLGDFIITGITLNDHNLIIKGAVPAALLALLINYLLGLFEKVVEPRFEKG